MGKRYSVYLAKDDTPILIYASAKRCADAMGVTRGTFYRYLTYIHSEQAIPRYNIYEDEPSNTTYEYDDSLITKILGGLC